MKLVNKVEEKFSLKLVALNSMKLVFNVQQLCVLECLLVNLVPKTMNLKFEKLTNENSPINIHKIIVEEDSNSGIFELKEENHLSLKIVFFSRLTGVFAFDFMKIHSFANKVSTLVEYISQDIVVN